MSWIVLMCGVSCLDYSPDELAAKMGQHA
jgi:hypothetical protein